MGRLSYHIIWYVKIIYLLRGDMHMRRRVKKCLCVLTAAAVMLGGLQIPSVVKAQESGHPAKSGRAAQSGGVTVYTNEEFMAALNRKESLIIVNNLITIGSEADADGRMLPVKIPGGTTIQGTGSGQLNARCPIQLEGDGVCFQNIKLTFESSTALGSVPHREIFLAGHSLTLDNVNTYLKGAGGSFGDLAGSEEELLPTVYAGAYTGSSVGKNASLTVINSNSETMFQGIYMGHGSEQDKKVPYTGEAELNIDARASVRDGVYTDLNSHASVNITGTESQVSKITEFYGNNNTTLTVDKISLERSVVDSIGNIVLKNKACLAPMTKRIQNITLQNGACLNFNNVPEATVSGNFSGETELSNERGILVLHAQGSLNIEGKVSGTTQFQTYHRYFPGTLLVGRDYITAKSQDASAQNFVLPQKKIDEGYGLEYAGGKWTVTGEIPVNEEIGWIDIFSAPSKVDLRKIPYQESGSDEADIIPDKDIYFGIKWYKKADGSEFNHNDIIESYGFYNWEYVIGIRTDYWESDSAEIQDKTDWGASIWLGALQNDLNRYYLRALNNAKPGEYTFLFCSEYIEPEKEEDPPRTVGQIKKLLEGKVMAERSVIFYNEDSEAPDSPEHKHIYQSNVTKRPTCTDTGTRTYICECGDTRTEEIKSLGHTEVIDLEVLPTETEHGKTEGSHCSVCGEILKNQEIIHTYESSVTKEATCTEKGIITYTCKICPHTYTEEIPAKGHTVVTDPRVEPTETTPGKTEGSHCEVCKEVFVEQEEIPVNHTHKYEISNVKAATCTEDGEKTFTCECGDAYTETIKATGHTEVADPEVLPTETEDGKTEGSHCSVCGEILKKQETIPATGTPEGPGEPEEPEEPDVPEEPDTPEEHTHTYQETVTKASTCTEKGIITYTCSCGDEYTEELPMSPHRYTEKSIIPASFNRAGKVQQICSVCKDVKDAGVIDGLQGISLNRNEYVYNGKAKKPSVTVKDSRGRSLVQGTDYQISYSKGRIKPGVYTVTVKLNGNYSGSMTGTFTIKPKKISLKKVTPKSKGIQVTWKKAISNADGYQIQYSTGKSFKGSAAKLTAAKKYASGKKISKLKPGKKYYVRIRTYKTVKSNGRKIKIYSAWSGIKAVRTKK